MKKLCITSTIFSLLTILFGCGLFNDVKVTDFSPTGQVDKLTTFTIEFSKDLAPADVQDKWLTDEFIEFKPKIEGKFKWESASRLIFSPDYQLQPIQSYKAKITNKVLFKTKYKAGFDDYEFHTPDFDAVKAEYFWTQLANENYKLSVKANLYFNYPVNPGSLKENIIVKNNGAVLTNYRIMSESASDVIALNLGDISQTDKEQKVEVIIKKGLYSVIGKKGMQDDRSFSYALPPITRLAITDVTSGYDDQKGWVEVSTTQRVDEKRIKSYIKLEPAKKLEFLVNDNSFRIEGDFSQSQILNLKILKGLPGLYGGQLEFDFEEQITLADISPSVTFSDPNGKYLLLSGNRNVELKAVNVPSVNIEVSQVFKNNILYFLDRSETYSRYDYNDENDENDEDEGYHYQREYDAGNYGRPYFEKSINLKNQINKSEKFNINLDKAFNEKQKGIFILNVSSKDDRWRRASKFVSMSDIGIIAKRGVDELIVFVNSIADTHPIEDVEITLISTNNQSVLSGKTDSKGIIHFKNIQDKLKGFESAIITAETKDDFNFIDLKATEVRTSRFDVGGEPSLINNYKIFLYGDRSLYRPGDNVYISGIVRNDETKIIKDEPVVIKIVSPAGKTYSEFRQTLNAEGSFEISFQVPDYIQTGEYDAQVFNGAGSLIGSYNFSVEEIVPDKIRVSLTNDKQDAKPGESVKVFVKAEYLFGAKASGLRYAAEFRVTHRSFSSKKYFNYDFSNTTNKKSETPNTTKDGVLNDKGETEITYDIPDELSSPGVATVTGYVNVFDPTGRTVTRNVSFDIYPEDYYVGIKSNGYYFGTNQTLKFKTVAVDKNDKCPGSFPAMEKLVRYEWQTVLKKDNSSKYYYASEKKEFPEWEKYVDLSKREKEISFSVSKSGEYELRVYKKGSTFYSRSGFRAYGWESSTASSFEVNKEGKVDISLDKEIYSPNDKAKILFTTPFSGKMLVTLERNGIYEYQYLDVKEHSAQLVVDLKEEYMPNIYVTATLFKKHTAVNVSPFFVGHGIVSLKVERKDFKLPVMISAPKKIKPNTKQDIVIKTASQKDVYVTLAAVDEGILQIDNYKTPEPYSFMYQKQQLNVQSFDLYKLLLPEVISKKSSTGGDGSDEQIRKRTNPITTKRFKLLAFWSGIKRTGGDGMVHIPLNIPQFNGEVRLMAVAYTGRKFGSSELAMKVADDLILEPQIPRFLAPNDSLVMPVTLINTTNSKGKVNVGVKVNGPMKVILSENKSITVPPNSTALTTFVIKTNNEIGAGKITIETSGFAKVRDITDISVRPVSPYTSQSNSGTIKGGNNFSIPLPGNFISSTKTSFIALSKFPAIQFSEQLRNLVGYPHGCVEQTVSKLFPQLYFEDLAKLVSPEHYRNYNPVYYVKEGIRKLVSMQLWDGSLSYWPGGTEASWWGSVYAAHFLVEAKKAGFNVPDNVLQKLLNYLANKAKEKKTYEYVTYNNNKRTVTLIADKEIIYSLYVLAFAGKSDISTMNYYKNRLNLISNDSRYLLAGSFALSGRWNSYYELVPGQFKEEKTDRLSGGSFDSDIRANALMLNILLEVEPSNKQVPFIIRYLTGRLKDMYSTQETSFALLALGKAAKLTSNSNVKVDLFVNNKSAGSFNGKDINIPIDRNAANLSVKSSGKGEVYYFQNTEGVKTGEVKEINSHMGVTRTYYDCRTKNIISGNQFYQGQLIACKISLLGYNIRADNIAITDLIPAGFEIENPRLENTEKMDWKSNMNIKYMDIRDDRLILFTNVDNSTHVFYYYMRVVNRGKFQLPVISAESMYEPDIKSVNGRGTVTVNEFVR